MQYIEETMLKDMNLRHACKEFDPTYIISQQDFETILEAGRLSPSSFGFEPWEMVVLQDRTLREEMRPLCWGAQGQLRTASHFVLIYARKPEAMRPNSPYIKDIIMQDTQHLPPEVSDLRRTMYGNFLEDDFVYKDNERAKFEWSARQCYIALGNMMTAAALMGIDSCPMEGFKKLDVEEFLDAKGLLDRESYGIACMVAFGKRKQDPRPKTRRTIGQVVRFVD